MTSAKPARELTAEDLRAHGIWRYKPEEALQPGEDESWLEPVAASAVTDATDHFFAIEARLADGSAQIVLVGGTEPLHPQYNEQAQFFVFIKLGSQLLWCPSQHDGHALASFLERQLHQVFPFAIDMSRYLTGDPAVLYRVITHGEPSGEA